MLHKRNVFKSALWVKHKWHQVLSVFYPNSRAFFEIKQQFVIRTRESVCTASQKKYATLFLQKKKKKKEKRKKEQDQDQSETKKYETKISKIFVWQNAFWDSLQLAPRWNEMLFCMHTCLRLMKRLPFYRCAFSAIYKLSSMQKYLIPNIISY